MSRGGIAARIGLFEVGQLREESLRRANSTFLVVKQQLDGRPKASVFRFDSGHQVRVATPASTSTAEISCAATTEPWITATTKMKFTNGARLHRWTRSGDPTLADCSSVPAGEWSDSSMFLTLGHAEFCIVTSNARFGFVHLATNIVASTTYAVWPPMA